jgi:hypothetical protein
LANSTTYLTTAEISQCQAQIDEAWKDNLLGEGTDNLGLQPRIHERDFGYNHSRWAIDHLNIALSILKSKNPYFATRNSIQVDISSAKIRLGDITGQEFTKVIIQQSDLTLTDLPINVNITVVGNAKSPYNYTVKKCTYLGINYWELNVGFTGSLNAEVEVIT